MKRTRPTTLIVLGVVAAGAGFLLQAALAAAAYAKFRPEYTLAGTLALIAVTVVILAVPIRRATRPGATHPVDPFYATRVAVLAKASALVGAAATGFGAGLLLELVSRGGAAAADAYLRVLLTLGSGILLLVAALVAEWLCTVRRRDDDDDRGDPPGTERVHGG